jgi:hypothetical protein
MTKIKPIEIYVKIKSYLKNAKMMMRENSKHDFQDLIKTVNLKCINTHLRPRGMASDNKDYEMDNKLQILSKSLRRIYPGHRHIILPIITKNSRKNDYDQIIFCETINRTKRYLTFNTAQIENNEMI